MASSAFTTLFVVFGLFSIGVGILLIILIFSMLAAERRSEMGMARAVGAQRAQLVHQFLSEGTVYALLIRIEQRGLVDVEKIPSEKGPPRKVYSLNAQGQEYLEEFWRTWSFLAERLEQLHEGGK